MENSTITSPRISAPEITEDIFNQAVSGYQAESINGLHFTPTIEGSNTFIEDGMLHVSLGCTDTEDFADYCFG